MVILSTKARQTISAAVDLYGSATLKNAWRMWVNDHPQSRRQSEPFHDGDGAMASGLLAAILGALEVMRRAMLDRRETPGLSEDEISDLDNDLSQVQSVERQLRSEPSKNPRLGQAILSH